MNASIFQTRALAQRSFLQKIFNQQAKQNAIIELNNLLASKSIISIQQSEVAEIENRHQLILGKVFKLNLEEFYASYLNYCLTDKSLSNDEINDLKHLKMLLSLEDNIINHLHIKIGTEVYRQSFNEAVSDGRLSKHEEAFLNKLEAELQLPKEIAEKISSETRTAYMQHYISGIIENERLSPDEEKEIQAIAGSLNINVQFSDQTKQKLLTLKSYWAIENLPLPAIQADIALQKSEDCYLRIANVNWYEMRTVRQRVSYTGYSASFKIAKGFYLRHGSYTPRSYSTDQMTLIDSGTLYLTNKRLIFIGYKKNSNIRVDKIYGISPTTDGLEIEKETGKSPTLQLPAQADIFYMMLVRLLMER